MTIELLVRPRLLRSLQSALQSGHVLVTAPAGYGKTVLLRSLAAHRPYAYYLPLTPADVDLPHLQGRVQETLRSAPENVSATLLLDDVHHLEGGPEALNWLVEQLEREAPRLVLAGRRVPSPALWDWVTKGALTHLEADDLACTRAESRAFLGQRYTDTPELVAAWHQRTGGWPLALALLARVQAAPDPQPVAEEELFTYLTRTLAQTLSPELLRFWTLTAVPLRFNDELAARLLGVEDDVTALRQEIQRRNLFLEPAEAPGWFRYHELIREFLLQQATEDLLPVFRQVIAWFEAHDDLEMAIEHALVGNLHETAARLLLTLPERSVTDQGRFLTYRRWVYSLDESLRTTHPELLIRLGTYLQEVPGMKAEARALLEEVLHLAGASGDTATQQRVLSRMARLEYVEGDRDQALARLRLLLEDPACQGYQRLYALFIAGPTLSLLGRFQEARQTFLSAIALARELGNDTMEMSNRINLALHVLIPTGQYESAQQHLDLALSHFEGSPMNAQYVLGVCCVLHALTGDWDQLATVLRKHEALMAQVEAPNRYQLLWQACNLAVLYAGRKRFDEAQAALARASDIAGDDPVVVAFVAGTQAWLFRSQGDPMRALRHAETVLMQPLNAPFSRAALALERDIAQAILGWEGASAVFPLHPETLNLIGWRARSELVRLRALLALRCWHASDPRWRRHVHAALFALRRPGYEYLLTQRDPDLGAPFWTVVLASGVAVQQAIIALQAIGNPEPVLTLLQHETPAVRTRAARALTAIGREEAMPPLATALSVERDPQTAAALKAALAHLKSQPPPPLKIKLMGDFALWRDG